MDDLFAIEWASSKAVPNPVPELERQSCAALFIQEFKKKRENSHRSYYERKGPDYIVPPEEVNLEHKEDAKEDTYLLKKWSKQEFRLAKVYESTGRQYGHPCDPYTREHNHDNYEARRQNKREKQKNKAANKIVGEDTKSKISKQRRDISQTRQASLRVEVEAQTKLLPPLATIIALYCASGYRWILENETIEGMRHAFRNGIIPVTRQTLYILVYRARFHASARQLDMAKSMMDFMYCEMGLRKEDLLKHFMGDHLPCYVGRRTTSDEVCSGRELMLDLQDRWGIPYLGCCLAERTHCRDTDAKRQGFLERNRHYFKYGGMECTDRTMTTIPLPLSFWSLLPP